MDKCISKNKLSSLRVVSKIEDITEIASNIGDWSYDKDLEYLSYYNVSHMSEKLECKMPQHAYKTMVDLANSSRLPDAIYYILVSGLWQKTNKYGYENIKNSRRVKIDAEYAEEALEIIEYELYDNHEAVLEILG